MARTFSASDEEMLRRLHGENRSRNQIAQEMGWSVGTITNHARRLGLDFDRQATRVAVEARQVDLKDRRQRLQGELLGLAEEQMARARDRYQLTGFDHVGNFVARWVDLPPARETKDLTTSAMSALARFDQKAKDEAGDEGRDTARGLLATLGEAMTAAARELGGDDADEYGS